MSLYLASSLVNPIQLLSRAINRLALGDIELAGVNQDRLYQVRYRKDELGVIGGAVQEMIAYQQASVGIALSIADGNLTADAQPRDAADQLGRAQVTMIDNLRGLVGQITRSASNLNVASAFYLIHIFVLQSHVIIQPIETTLTSFHDVRA
jgi:methyl-accepting chemotaxis protein